MLSSSILSSSNQIRLPERQRAQCSREFAQIDNPRPRPGVRTCNFKLRASPSHGARATGSHWHGAGDPGPAGGRASVVLLLAALPRRPCRLHGALATRRQWQQTPRGRPRAGARRPPVAGGSVISESGPGYRDCPTAGTPSPSRAFNLSAHTESSENTLSDRHIAHTSQHRLSVHPRDGVLPHEIQVNLVAEQLANIVVAVPVHVGADACIQTYTHA